MALLLFVCGCHAPCLSDDWGGLAPQRWHGLEGHLGRCDFVRLTSGVHCGDNAAGTQWVGLKFTSGKVVRYYRPHKKVLASPIAPRNTGYEPQLYSLDGFPNAQKQWIEKYFMTPVVDDPASRAFNRLVNGKELPSAWASAGRSVA
jgi:hypothetical protein